MRRAIFAACLTGIGGLLAVIGVPFLVLGGFVLAVPLLEARGIGFFEFWIDDQPLTRGQAALLTLGSATAFGVTGCGLAALGLSMRRDRSKPRM